MKEKILTAVTGGISGFINGLFGSGGGIIAVPLLKKSGLSQREAQATSLLLTFFLSGVSAGIYLSEGRVAFSDAVNFIPGGIIGGVAAALFFKKIKPKILKKIFGGIVVFFAAKSLWEVAAQWIF